MKVDIWSDIMCPYCYIGKRKYEEALKQFPHADEVETEWHSYQLDPDIPAGNKQKQYDYIAQLKGWSLEETIATHKQLTDMAKEVGLEYNFDKMIVANTFDAHRLSHLAKKSNRGDASEEALFKAFFTDGKDINDKEVLMEIGKSIGLEEVAVREMLNSKQFKAAVLQDFENAEAVEVDVVPFFLINNQLIVTGSQPVSVFLDALTQAYKQWKKDEPGVKSRTIGNGPSCTIDGVCE